MKERSLIKLSVRLASLLLIVLLASHSGTYAQDRNGDDRDCPGPGCPGRTSASSGSLADGIIAGIIAGALLGTVNQENRSQTRASPPSRELGSPQTRSIQLALNAAGFEAGEADGLSGPKTRKAIGAFQSSRGEEATGTLTPEQLGALLVTFYESADEAQVPISLPDRNNEVLPSSGSNQLILSCQQDGSELRCTTIDDRIPILQLEKDS